MFDEIKIHSKLFAHYSFLELFFIHTLSAGFPFSQNLKNSLSKRSDCRLQRISKSHHTLLDYSSVSTDPRVKT